MSTIDNSIIQRAKSWLSESYDNETRIEVTKLIEESSSELVDSFYRNLEFGTGGLRGIMGVGTNRMNKYTVGMATQGLANYLNSLFKDREIKVAIAYDSRNNSSYFAQITAEVMSGNGIKVFLFDKLRPTPELSFAVRYLRCQAGIVITASHNPKEYNGYKVYWNDGGQLVPPHDKNVIAEVEKITNPEMVVFKPNVDKIQIIGNDIDEVYFDFIRSLSINRDVIQKNNQLSIVYTPIHGTGIMGVPQMLSKFGFQNVHLLDSQIIPDGNFPTVKSPNPEERETMSLAIEKASELNAELVLATDPDADRVGVACKDHHGNFVLLNGNQTAAILYYYILSQWNEKNKFKGNEFVVKTIVTSELLSDIAKYFKVQSFDVLTGFKYIAEIIRKYEGQKQFIVGGEESYGYLVSDFVRDKDALISCSMIAEATAWAKSNGMSLMDVLIEIYLKFGFYKEDLISITKKGKAGADEIKEMMEIYRKNPPLEINHSQVVEIRDYKLSVQKNIISGHEEKIDMPTSDVIQFFTADGSKITVRPSGTEPKIKFYFGIKEHLKDKSDFDRANQAAQLKIKEIITSLGL